MAVKKTEVKVVNESKLRERVPLYIPRPEGDKSGYCTVSVNGKNYQIEYGKTVMVPAFVKEAWDNAIAANDEAQKNIAEAAEAFSNGKGI